VLVDNHFFVIFDLLDVSVAVKLCINCSFFTFIIINCYFSSTFGSLNFCTKIINLVIIVG